jgi:DNA-binding Xre family transcriptional regulator
MATKNLNRIKVMLADRNQTNKWLAEQVGKDPATVSKWVTNASQPSLEMIFRIAELLKCNYTDLIRDIEEQDPIIVDGES